MRQTNPEVKPVRQTMKGLEQQVEHRVLPLGLS